jgi:hypothetical protein
MRHPGYPQTPNARTNLSQNHFAVLRPRLLVIDSRRRGILEPLPKASMRFLVKWGTLMPDIAAQTPSIIQGFDGVRPPPQRHKAAMTTALSSIQSDAQEHEEAT